MGLLSNDINNVNQILPHKNKWAWDLYLTGLKNHWVPTDVPMQEDIQQWKSNILSDDERLLIKRCLGFFACSESLVGNNILLNIYRYVQDGECRQYLSNQLKEEAVHNLTVVYCCDSLNLEPNEIYEAYLNVPTVKLKDDFLIKQTSSVYSKDFDINNYNDRKQFVKSLFIYYILFEGLLFYNSFAALLSLKRRNLIPGIATQVDYQLKDEHLHVTFGTQLINRLELEKKTLYYSEAINLLGEVIELEKGFVNEMIPHGLLGFNKEGCYEYIKFLANRRFEDLGFERPFSQIANPFSWLSENLDLPKMKNFFESTVTEYQSGNLIDDMD